MEATLYAVYDPKRKNFLRYTEDSNDDYCTHEWVQLHEYVTLGNYHYADELKRSLVGNNKYLIVPVVLTTPTLP